MWISDESAYVKDSANYHNIAIRDGHQCIRMRHNEDGWRAVDEWCGHNIDFACEFACNKGATKLQCKLKLILMSYFPIILVVNPKFICMDEPTNVLDADNDYTGNDELWVVGSNVT